MRRFAVFIAMAALAGPWSLTAGTLPGDPCAEPNARCEDEELIGGTTESSFSEYFGVAMDLTGDQALIGALSRSEPTLGYAGGVYDLRLISGSWTQVDVLLPDDIRANDNFGGAVSRSGDTAVIGAPGRGTWRYGTAFSYRYAAGAWSLEDEFAAPACPLDVPRDQCPPGSEDPRDACPRRRDLQKRSELGSAVAISGDWALVTAPYEDLCFLTSDDRHCIDEDQGDIPCRIVDRKTRDWVGTDAGAAYFYRRNATSGLWEDDPQRVEPTDLELILRVNPTETANVRRDDFTDLAWARRDGMIDIEGDLAVIATDTNQVNAVWVYQFNATTQQWEELAESPLRPPSAGNNVGFGTSVSIGGGWLAIGADEEDLAFDGGPNVTDAGAVYLYRWDGSAWIDESAVSPVLLANQSESDRLGRDVEITADTLLAGAMNHLATFRTGGGGSEIMTPGPGAVYVFDLDPSGPSVTERSKLVASNGEQLDGLGGSLAYEDGTAFVAAAQRAFYIDDDGVPVEPFTGSVYTYDLPPPAPGAAPVPEPARGLLALAALASLALLRSRLGRAR
ncbi:MAG: FG-GAP repeat protein [Deltaproteobacteria bacterium]|nr:FG-GAP repeat protein [Deltaproteobacteria bacterium]